MLYEQELNEYKELEQNLKDCTEFMERAVIISDMHELSECIYREIGLPKPEGHPMSYKTLKNLVEKYQKENIKN